MTLYIPGQPVPCGRPRVTRFGTFTPDKTRRYKTYLIEYLRLHWSGPPLEIAHVRAVFLMDRPKRLLTKGANPDRYWCVTKPDCDNLVKSPLDAATEVGVWKDDGRAAWLEVVKLYRALNEGPGAYLTITEASAPPAWAMEVGR